MKERPSSGYEAWFTAVRLRPRLRRRSVSVLGLVAAAAFAGLITLAMTRASGLVAGTVAAATTLTLLIVYVILWVEFTGRVHWYLVRMVRWNDFSRLSLFLAAFFGFPVVTIGPVLA